MAAEMAGDMASIGSSGEAARLRCSGLLAAGHARFSSGAAAGGPAKQAAGGLFFLTGAGAAAIRPHAGMNAYHA